MVQLSTGWKHWDKHLSQFAGLNEPIHALEIGSYEGDATVWLLKNLCKYNNKSTMTCIDTWEGSPEYVGINFNDIEKQFDKNIIDSGFMDKVKKIKKLSYDGLIELLANKNRPEFHIIFIDASHEARDVLADAILSWKMLKPKGVMIFDDYKWTKLSPEYFRPKPAIDAFMLCMKPELKVLDIQYQVFIQKLEIFEQPIKTIGRGSKSRSRSRSRSKLKKK
jgi:predicted O-methyltransferase YrrM